MPTTRRRRRQEARDSLDTSMRVFFETGSYDAAKAAGIAVGEVDERGGFRGMIQLLLKHPGHEALWREHGEEIVADWIAEHPGTRPWKWWAVDAREPRRRLGGIGTPAHEALAYAPSFAFGIPTHWVSPWDVAYYTGRARDVHGRPIGTELVGHPFCGVAIDPQDPPRYEAQASYLSRLQLLTAAERRALTPEDFEPEVVLPAAEDGEEEEEEDA
jgi:hypothetical protein